MPEPDGVAPCAPRPHHGDAHAVRTWLDQRLFAPPNLVTLPDLFASVYRLRTQSPLES